MRSHKEMESEKVFLMFYHTAIRNVGLFTSVSVALLGYSRFYRGKLKTYNIAFIIISLLVLLCAILICYYLILDLHKINENIKSPVYTDKWIIIPKIALGTDILIGLFGLYTLYREMTK